MPISHCWVVNSDNYNNNNNNNKLINIESAVSYNPNPNRVAFENNINFIILIVLDTKWSTTATTRAINRLTYSSGSTIVVSLPRIYSNSTWRSSWCRLRRSARTQRSSRWSTFQLATVSHGHYSFWSTQQLSGQRLCQSWRQQCWQQHINSFLVIFLFFAVVKNIKLEVNKHSLKLVI